MSYSSVVEMAHSNSLIGRMIAAAAAEQVPSPEVWIRDNVWTLVSSPNWSADWDFAKAAYKVDLNPDTGAREDVISDAKILDAVQAAKAAEAAPQP